MLAVLRDASVFLRDELREMHLLSGRAAQCAIAALAVALSTTVALAINIDDPWWAAISGFMSTQATAPASLRRGLLRIAGTAGGATLAVMLSPWLINDIVAMSLALMVISTMGVLGLLVSPHGYAWLLGAITVDMILLSALTDPTSTLNFACDRVAEVTIGTAAAMLMTWLLAPTTDAPVPAMPGWSDLFGAQWPALQHALRAGLCVMLVPPVWSLLDLPSLAQMAVTVAAVTAVPAVTGNAQEDERVMVQRSLHRLLGCAFGGAAGLLCLAFSVENFLPWLAMLTAGSWIAAHVQGSQRSIGYVGTQAAMVFIMTLVQGDGPPSSIMPGLDRLAGIAGGLMILLVVTLLTAPAAEEVRAE